MSTNRKDLIIVNHIKKIVVLLPVAMLMIGLFTAIMTSVSILPEHASFQRG